MKTERLVGAIRGLPAPISMANRNDESMLVMNTIRTDRQWLERTGHDGYNRFGW